MANFRVTFERSDGSVGSDTFSEETKGGAVHDFHECYRHDVYKVLSVEEVKDAEKETGENNA